MNHWVETERRCKTLGVKPLSREGNSQTGDWMPKKFKMKPDNELSNAQS